VYREDWLPVWDHSSSDDLVHWIHHPPALLPAFDGSTPRGIYSGDAVENAPEPTLIYHVPSQGTCIATSEDDELIRWAPSPANPVIRMSNSHTEYVVFDPCAWREGDTYYALIGNKSWAPGYEGDCTSLFRSADLLNWVYLHPFYRSERRWTDEIEDCACPDFFPLGDRHMLLMHTHQPHAQCQYYLGRYENQRFFPEDHGRMNWPGGQLSGPETLSDDRGRRIFFGWIREARPWGNVGWGSVMSLPRVLSLGSGGTLHMQPVPELQALRRYHRRYEAVRVPRGGVVDLTEVSGDCLELSIEVEPTDAEQFGLLVRCSPDSDEQTAIVCDRRNGLLRIELDRSTLDSQIKYPKYSTASSSPARAAAPNDWEELSESERYVQIQEAPFSLTTGEGLCLHLFLDRSVLEVFANQRQCLTQRIYPSRPDSLGVRLFSKDAEVVVRSVDAWDMAPVNPC